MAKLTEGQLQAISIMERTCSVVSILGCLFTIVTFTCFRAFQEKPINRLVFYASFGNLMSCVGTLMSRSFLDHPNSFGCQLQALLIQWFMAADAGWILAMAINVYLTLYRKYDSKRLRRMELTYLLACYGIPFIPAFVLVFIKRNGVRVYGDAVLWCWIEEDWEALRIAVFYGPAWLVILLTMFIYVRAGRTIYMTRKELRRSSDISLLSPESEKETSSRHTEVSLGRRLTIGSMPSRPMPPVAVEDAVEEVLGPCGRAEDSTTDPTASPPPPPQLDGSTRARRHSYEFKSAAWSYTKTSLLYFTGILLIWTPSSANRVYALVHGGTTIAPLAYMSGLVLPLQGFWNWLIYTVVSWPACKDIFRRLKSWVLRLIRPSTRDKSDGHSRKSTAQVQTVARSPSSFDCESGTALPFARDG
ncbi:G-protein coupled receptor [Purpureocillium lilacinum]|uniref:G-protein coupled receptor n=1 Tax=Purpureocillium lilacinum TaxID=33203 RepID=A0A179HLL4_PURLI|nr:G-protein coupled receptor [Purpureocillium lilacinum]OAQ83478.1 G-protein coupled receptor [Purpureocillium lilacinum]OAQ90263.1 G-protein coupled receptor [Purpureocillium lilacinum]